MATFCSILATVLRRDARRAKSDPDQLSPSRMQTRRAGLQRAVHAADHGTTHFPARTGAVQFSRRGAGRLRGVPEERTYTIRISVSPADEIRPKCHSALGTCNAESRLLPSREVAIRMRPTARCISAELNRSAGYESVATRLRNRCGSVTVAPL